MAIEKYTSDDNQAKLSITEFENSDIICALYA